MKYLFTIITIIFACSLIAPLQAKKLNFQQANGIAREMLGQSKANKATKRLILNAALKASKSKNGPYYREEKLKNSLLSMLAPAVAPKASSTSTSTNKSAPKSIPVMASPSEASTSTAQPSINQKPAPLNEVVVNENRNAHLQPTDKNKQGKKILRKNYRETKNQHGMNIELMQIQGILQGELGDLGAGTCGPLAIYHTIKLTNYCITGDAQNLLDLIDQQKAKAFLKATGDILRNACEEQLDGILAHATTAKTVAQKPASTTQRFGHVNTISIPGEHVSDEKARLAEFVPISHAVKAAIGKFHTNDTFSYALIIADIEPGKYGHYYCVVINKLSKLHAQFILVDSGSCDHFAVARKKQILEGLINLFTVYPENLL